ncbi:protein ALP1-like [Ipomoea triloba]|uniref:protein ALP1-like n=1 Tax=Ipomoea triloba TaxID=35885 RepID=UPI00125DBF08|nr:protein ALP1-like [Ipomoea triloba]XP_031101556.1 protein ALP1-like [Ipomoea triloba]
MTIDEMVISFLHIIAHNIKNRVLKRQIARSGETVSRQFHAVLNSVLRLHDIMFRKPEPIPDNSTDDRWKWFKGCLGALDGTFIKVNVETVDRPRYRTRKGEIATNVLGVCTPDMHFIYVLPGWEGSAADGRVLRDAISRKNGLKVPQGNYYLCDAGYTNGDGFLAPYRGQRYHLNEWRQGYQPATAKEYFNMKHSQARNCIERCFGILKARWCILRDKSFYPVKTQCRIISACCILHNFIRSEMSIDPIEIEVPQTELDNDYEEELITHCETSSAWTEWRDKLADEMFTNWPSLHH